jgi:3-hydroxyanthranilate 3,4-dioxygenase
VICGRTNHEKDYHWDKEELFYQIEGDIVVKIIDEGKQRDIHIKEGEMFLLHDVFPILHSARPNNYRISY